MAVQSALYSAQQAALANLTLQTLGLTSWEPESVRGLQKTLGMEPDGWLGPATVAAWKAMRRLEVPSSSSDALAGKAIVDRVGYIPPERVTVVNFLQKGGIAASPEDVSPRKRAVTQFVLHRGAAMSYKPGLNYAVKTEAVLDSRGLSTTFSQDIDGVFYQHFDPSLYRGRHCTHHNVQSDSLDIGGPFSASMTPAPGQELLTIPMAIGVEGDTMPPMKRPYRDVKCWSLTASQAEALAAFLPWWCELRGIPLTACEDWRCFRVTGLGVEDPVTNVPGILAHAQISEPGRRVDGILALFQLRKMVDLGWRSGEQFLPVPPVS